MRPDTSPADVDDADDADDLFVFAADAYEAADAVRRYGFAMNVLLLPPDPTTWAVAAAGAPAERAVQTAREIEEQGR